MPFKAKNKFLSKNVDIVISLLKDFKKNPSKTLLTQIRTQLKYIEDNLEGKDF